MKKRFYAAKDEIGLVSVTTELDKDNIVISVADNKLNWNSVNLNEEQSKGFKQFMREKEMSLPDFDRSTNPCPVCGINNNSPFPCEHYRGKPDVIKAALSVGTFNTSDANLGSTVPNNSIFTKEIWNAAIEAAANKIKGAPLFANEIRKLKK